MKLTRLVIHRYRGIAPGSELVFGPSLNWVLGDNGSGRTTLLDLISTVLCTDFSGLIREEFSLEYTLGLPGMEILIRARNVLRSGTPALLPGGADAPPEEAALLPLAAPLEPSLDVTLRLAAPASRIELRTNAEGIHCEVDGQPAWSRTMHWSLLDRSVWTLLFMTAQYLAPEVKERLKDLLRRTFLLAPPRFDESLGMFERIGHIRYAMETRDGEVFPLGLMALPTWMPAWLRERMERAPDTETLVLRHDEMPRSFLDRFVTLAGFEAGTLHVAVLERRTFEGGGRLGFGQFGFRFTRRDGRVLTEAELGHGQKRLLSFLYYLDVNEDFVVADELASGLHPRQVEACVREMGTRQAFLTSQNPLLFEHLSFASAAEVQSSLIRCGTAPLHGREWIHCANPTEAEARKLFEDARVASRSMGALLREQGWW